MNSPIGAHTFIWSARWDREGARRAVAGAVRSDFELVEIPLLDPQLIDTGDTVRILDSAGLSCTCSLALPADTHLPDAPERAVSYLTRAVDVAAEIGSTWLTGALYGNLGTLTGSCPTAAELDTIAGALTRVAHHASARGVSLGLELINRYETYILNTVTQACELLDRIDAPNVYAHLDTFHMNIEERAFAGAVERLGDRLGYVHLAESDRGPLGSGHVPFPDLLDALERVGFSGPIVVEAFINADPRIRSATATWRADDLDPDRFAADAIAYLRSIWPSGAG